MDFRESLTLAMLQSGLNTLYEERKADKGEVEIIEKIELTIEEIDNRPSLHRAERLRTRK
jgi:hypothetical protein